MNRPRIAARARTIVICGLTAVLGFGALGLLISARNSSSTPSTASRTTPGSGASKTGLIAFTRYRLQDEPLWSEIYIDGDDGSGRPVVPVHTFESAGEHELKGVPDTWRVYAAT